LVSLSNGSPLVLWPGEEAIGVPNWERREPLPLSTADAANHGVIPKAASIPTGQSFRNLGLKEPVGSFPTHRI
jgi:hypothetical protein